MTIQEAIDAIRAATGAAPLADTVDTVKSGDPSGPLTGVVTTFMATAAVLTRAAELGANLVIPHEPLFYNHRDEVDWLADDPVYLAKRRLLDAHGLVVWRFHDYWHRTRPDGILSGMLPRLGGRREGEHERPCIVPLAPTTLADIAAHLKARLGAVAVRVTGPDDLVCRRIGLLVGAPGGRAHIAALGRDDVDAIVCGEINEWEACEYARDATFLGRRRGLIVIGHANSEEAGMAYLATWLRPVLPGVAIHHVPAGDPLRTL